MEIIVADLLEYEKEMAALEAEQAGEVTHSDDGYADEKGAAFGVHPVTSVRSVRTNNLSPVVSGMEAVVVKK
ncbi:hypothetical protein FOG48_03836 [Hanseniaspora uvarum]|nr:hypothetical protein FOG48_03836 [Hanseniaspora uvarum]